MRTALWSIATLASQDSNRDRKFAAVSHAVAPKNPLPATNADGFRFLLLNTMIPNFFLSLSSAPISSRKLSTPSAGALAGYVVLRDFNANGMLLSSGHAEARRYVSFGGRELLECQERGDVGGASRVVK